MSTENELSVKITADNTELQSGLSGASSAVKDGLASWSSAFKDAEGAISGNVTNIVSSLMKVAPAIAIVAGALATLKIAKDSLSSFEQYADEVRHLQEYLGISAREASSLKVALDVLGVSSETYTSIVTRLERQLRSHADEYTRLGVVIRDVNTNAFLPTTQIIDNVVNKMREYKAGTDQIKVAMDLLGPRGAQVAFELMHLQEAMGMSKDQMDKLGLSMSESGVNAAHKFGMETRLLGEEWKAVKINIGQQVMPALSGLMGSLMNVGGPVINFVVEAVKILIETFDRLITAVKIVYTEVKAVFMSIGTLIGGTVAAVVQALSGDLKGAIATFRAASNDAGAEFGKANAKIYADSQALNARLKNLWNEPVGPKAPATSGSKSAPEDSAQAKKDLEAWVEAQHTKQEAVKQFADQWMAIEDNILARLKAAYGASSKEYQSELGRKIKMTQEYANQQKEIEATDAEMKKDAAEHAIAMKKEELAQEVALGKISKKQEYAALLEYENEKYALAMKALDDNAKTYENDKVKYEKVLAEKQKLTEKYELAVKKLADQETLQYYTDWKNTMMSVAGIFEQGLNTMLTSHKSFNQQMKSLLDQLAMYFINDYIKKTVSNWLFKEQQEYSISQMYSKLKQVLGMEDAASEELTATTSASLVGATNALKAGSNIAVAATGAASAVAPTPYIGPALALAAAAAMIAGLAIYKSQASAAEGFDVPSGMNPLTQIHSEEMVLPARLANVIRDLATGGKGGSSSTYNITALDTKSFMSRNGSQILKGIKGHMRNLNRRF